MSRIFFEEKQKFTSPALIISMGVIYLGVTSVFLFGFYRQFVLGLPFGSKPLSDAGLLIAGLLSFVVLFVSAWLLFGSVLQVTITDKGVLCQFWPFFRKQRVISPQEISHWEVRTYKPIVEYGGWGVRWGNSKTGDAYNVHGNKGLQLVLKSGKRLLIGTQRPEAIAYAMKKMLGGAHE